MANNSVVQRFGRIKRAQAAAKEAAPEGKQEIVPAQPAPVARAQKTITIPDIKVQLPGLHLPANMLSWVMLVLAVLLFKLSTDATDAFIGDLRPGTSYYAAIIVQIGCSAVERYFFAGAKNGFTIFILFTDGFINAWGLFYAILPRFFSSGAWSMVSTAWGDQLTLGPRGLLFVAILLGVFVAYGNDKLFTMATSGK